LSSFCREGTKRANTNKWYKMILLAARYKAVKVKHYLFFFFTPPK
jgi:hypothetical protein